MTIDDRLIQLWETSGERAKGTPLDSFTTSEECDDNTPRIAFCTAIKGPERFETYIGRDGKEHSLLRDSLRHNIKIFNKKWEKEHYRPKVKFVVLAYGEPELEQFMLENFRDEIASGIIVFATTQAEHWEYATAKNAVARVAIDYAKCDFICNVDGDNRIGRGGAADTEGALELDPTPDFITYLQNLFRLYPNAISRAMSGTEGELGIPLMRGMGGRIAMSKENFLRARGYDEVNFAQWGGDDPDLVKRVLASTSAHGGGPRFFPLTDPRIADSVLEHDSEFRWKNLPLELQETSQQVEFLSSQTWLNPQDRNPEQAAIIARLHLDPYDIPPTYANPDGWKTTQVEIVHYAPDGTTLHHTPFELTPLRALAQEELEGTARRLSRSHKQRRPGILLHRIITAFSEMGVMEKNAILYEASREQQYQGFEPIERRVAELISKREKSPVFKNLISENYKRYQTNLRKFTELETWTERAYAEDGYSIKPVEREKAIAAAAGIVVPEILESVTAEQGLSPSPPRQPLP